MSRRLKRTRKYRGAGSGLVRSPPRAAASELLPRLLLCHADAPAPLLACAGPLMLNPAFESHESDKRTRVCHADAPAPLGSRERASRGCPHRRCRLPPAGRCRPTFVTATASDTPYTQPGLCASRVPPTRPRRRSACACTSGHAPIRRRCLIPLRRPDRTPNTVSCPETVVPPGRSAKRANPNPWRLTRSCTESGNAPAAQNCPRSRTRLTPWLRRFLGAANAVGASEAGVHGC